MKSRNKAAKVIYPVVAELERLAVVYHNDAATRSMNEEQRLAYRQQYSAPIMSELKQYLADLLTTHQVAYCS